MNQLTFIFVKINSNQYLNFKIKEKGHTKLHSLQNIQTCLDFLKSYKVNQKLIKTVSYFFKEFWLKKRNLKKMANIFF